MSLSKQKRRKESGERGQISSSSDASGGREKRGKEEEKESSLEVRRGLRRKMMSRLTSICPALACEEKEKKRKRWRPITFFPHKTGSV